MSITLKLAALAVVVLFLVWTMGGNSE